MHQRRRGLTHAHMGDCLYLVGVWDMQYHISTQKVKTKITENSYFQVIKNKSSGGKKSDNSTDALTDSEISSCYNFSQQREMCINYLRLYWSHAEKTACPKIQPIFLLLTYQSVLGYKSNGK